MFEEEIAKVMTRRHFFRRTGLSVGSMALASLCQHSLFARSAVSPAERSFGALNPLHFPPRAKRIIYLFMSGGPSQLDTFDYKPKLVKLTGTDLPASVRGNQRITGMTSGQKHLLCVGTPFQFHTYGRCGAQMSEIFPHLGKVADEIAILRAVHTDPINHDPAVTFIGTGFQQPGRPTLGAWMAYGLGSENQNLPSFIVMISGGGGQPLQARYWGNGFLPSNYQGVQFRNTGDPVLYVSNPSGIGAKTRRLLLNGVQELNRMELGTMGDPEISARIDAYEMAFRMQTSVPELTDLSTEPQSVLDMYGAQPGKPSFANNCLLARRLCERGVRFIQLFHRDWDHHSNLPNAIRREAKMTDRACWALLTDLKQRGLLDDTIVIWGGEFGRTAYSQGDIRKDSFGRDHHPRSYSMWLAGGGFKPGLTYGETDDFGYNIVRDGVHVHDLHATILYCMGIDHKRFTYHFQGRDYRLTDVAGQVVKPLLA